MYIKLQIWFTKRLKMTKGLLYKLFSWITGYQGEGFIFCSSVFVYHLNIFRKYRFEIEAFVTKKILEDLKDTEQLPVLQKRVIVAFQTS